MTDDERVQIARIAQAFEDFVIQYGKDEQRKETARVEEREERRIFRDEMTQKVDALEKKIAPVVFHHQIIVHGGKWVVATVGSVLGAVKGWVFIKDHFK